MIKIYDFSNHSIKYENLWFFIIVVIILILVYCNQYINQESKFSNLLKKKPFEYLFLGKEDFDNKNKVNIGILFCFLLSFFILVSIFQPYLYRNYLKYFKETKSISGKVNSLTKMNNFNIYFFKVKNQNFSVFESNFITNRNIYDNDSVRITYFEDKNNLEINLKIIKIELFNP